MARTEGAGKPVVLVDPFADEREMYEEALRHGGYEVVACEKLADVLRFVREAAVTVVITRIVQGPGVEWTGVELTRRLKHDDRTKHIPVIVMTTRIEPRWRVAAERAGCDSFLMLPCAPDMLLSEVERVTSTPPRQSVSEWPSSGADPDWRLVWRLRSPSDRQLTCQMRRHEDQFELFIADANNEQIMATSFEALAELHEKAAALRGALEARGYVPPGYARGAGARIGSPSEGRTAFCGLIECAEIFSLDNRDVGTALRDAATMGVAALGLQDGQMAKNAIALSRDALNRARGRRASDDALVKSCEALLEQVEASLPP